MRLVCFIAALTLSATGVAAEPAPPAITAYVGVTVIDGTGAPPRPEMTVVVEGERIAAIAPAGAAQIPPGARVADMRGRYVLPGLIDSHVHLATPPNRRKAEATLRREIYSGVTAVRDMADDDRAVADLARAARVQEIPGPEIYYAALVAGTSFFADPRTHAVSQGAVAGELPWMRAVTPDSDLPMVIAMARGSGATGLKIYANLSGDLVARITAEAHRQGFPVWAHAAVYPATPAEVAAAGVDVVSHACLIAYQAQSRMPARYGERVPVDMAALGEGDNPVLAPLFARMARQNTILDATLHVYVHAAEADRGRIAAGLPPISACPTEAAFRVARQAHRAGVRISAGTDGDTPWSAAYPAVHEEIEILADHAGLTPMEAIRAATQTAAATIGQSDSMGTLQVGKLANLVFLSRDPLADIHNIRSVVLTVKRGRAYARDAYVPVTRDELADPQ